MADDWAVTHRDSGEVQYIKVAPGKRPASHGYPAELFTARKLDREPHEDDLFDGRTLKSCPVKRAKRERQSRLAELSRAELVDLIAQMIDEKLDARVSQR
jgi:hypothetical protein